MNHVFVDQGKNINVVVGLYKKINNETKKINADNATETINFLDLTISFK